MKTLNVNLLYAYKFIGQCLPIYAFYTILFLQRGLSVSGIATLIALWSVFAILFEIPSGVLADRWNRRNMLAIAAALQGICFVIWFFAHSLLWFAVGFVFWAIAGAFTSGTEEGLLYDHLKCDGHEENFTKIYGKAQFYANAGTIAGLASAGLIASFIRIEIMALLSAAICFVNVLLALQLPEKNSYAERMGEESPGFFGTLKEAGLLLKGSGMALGSILFLVLFANLGSYLDEFDALIISDFHLENIWVSVILVVRFIFAALGDLLAPMVEKRVSSTKQLFLVSCLAYAFLLIFSLWWNQYALFPFGLAFMVMSIAEVLLVNALQGEIKEEGRATVMSFYGAGQNIAMIGFSLLYGLLSELLTLQQVYILLSVYGIVGGLSFCLLARIIKSRTLTKNT